MIQISFAKFVLIYCAHFQTEDYKNPIAAIPRSVLLKSVLGRDLSMLWPLRNFLTIG